MIELFTSALIGFLLGLYFRVYAVLFLSAIFLFVYLNINGISVRYILTAFGYLAVAQIAYLSGVWVRCR